jgi:membrane complex biogenesis BtpA family protein
MHFLSLHKPIIGMIHLPALPGTPRHQLSPQALVDQVLAEAETYQEAGIDALMIENMHDRPYLNQTVGPEIVAMVTRIASELRRVADCPCGLQILAGANQEALAVAHATGLDFIRAEGFVFGHVADEGYIDAQAGALLRYRKQIGAEQVKILTDIKKKHSSHALTADVSLAETAEAAAFFLSDGLVITGTATGKAADLEEIRQVKQQVKLPVLVGSGVTLENVTDYLALADGLIIGSYFKQNGHWSQAPDSNRIRSLMERVRGGGI